MSGLGRRPWSTSVEALVDVGGGPCRSQAEAGGVSVEPVVVVGVVVVAVVVVTAGVVVVLGEVVVLVEVRVGVTGAALPTVIVTVAPFLAVALPCGRWVIT